MQTRGDGGISRLLKALEIAELCRELLCKSQRGGLGGVRAADRMHRIVPTEKSLPVGIARFLQCGIQFREAAGVRHEPRLWGDASRLLDGSPVGFRDTPGFGSASQPQALKGILERRRVNKKR